MRASRGLMALGTAVLLAACGRASPPAVPVIDAPISPGDPTMVLTPVEPGLPNTEVDRLDPVDVDPSERAGAGDDPGAFAPVPDLAGPAGDLGGGGGFAPGGDRGDLGGLGGRDGLDGTGGLGGTGGPGDPQDGGAERDEDEDEDEDDRDGSVEPPAPF